MKSRNGLQKILDSYQTPSLSDAEVIIAFPWSLLLKGDEGDTFPLEAMKRTFLPPENIKGQKPSSLAHSVKVLFKIHLTYPIGYNNNYLLPS